MERPKRPCKDERDQQIETRSRSAALDLLTAATQVLTILCLIKGNPAWRGSLSLLFFGGGAQLFYKYEQYRERPYLWVGAALGLATVGGRSTSWMGRLGQRY